MKPTEEQIAIIAKHYPPAPSTPEGLRTAIAKACVWYGIGDESAMIDRIMLAIAPFIPASTTEGRK